MTTLDSNQRYTLYGADFKANPYPTYAAMRKDSPICQHPGLHEQTQIWFVTRHADVEMILRDHKRFVKSIANTLTAAERSRLRPSTRVDALLNQHMLNMDGQDHARLRALVSKAFSARQINDLEQPIQALADELLDRVADTGEMDLIDDYAFPLPINVIAALLGLPPSDHDLLHQWSNAFITPAITTEQWQKTESLLNDFVTYLDKILAERRAFPREDLITALIQAEESGDKLSEEELYGMTVLLIVAGHETTVNLIGNGVLSLLHHPNQLAKLRRRPELVPNAVEEILRFNSPVERASIRFAAEDVHIDGQLIRRGEAISVVLASAGRDALQYDQPDNFNIERDVSRHLGFGRGVHYCLGAPLARLEARIALQTLIQRLPTLRLAVPAEELTWRLSPIIRGMKHMPVVWDV